MNDIPIEQRKHSITIEYCVPCNYSQRALDTAAELVLDYQHIINKLELIMGTRGAFEVSVDGEALFSKKEEKRFPEAEEIRSRFKALVGANVATYPQD
jgi:selenoprotein W-related protein